MSLETPVQTVLTCSQCGRALAQSELVQIAGNWVCADCKPAFLSRVMASGGAGASPSAWHYGGFWMRFGARMIDGLILLVPLAILAAMLLPNLLRAMRQAPSAPNPMFAAGFLTIYVFSYLVGACYEILLLKYRGATLGKMACGLKVVRSNGSNLSWGVCFGRFFMWNVVTSGIPYLNFIMMPTSSIMLGVDDEKRALHDRVCDTRVIYNRA
ncbi:MAG TPA: RDD family protein [Candidatus Sulfotelmatobacter sp.]|nr:RDD family protein [Candidatus Sulfotelmatobacter sp.]